MSGQMLVLFALTALPLICTPGPDILFVAGQSVRGKRSESLRALLGVLSGYMAHAVLASLGVAAIVASSPLLFDAIRWLGVAYLLFLAVQMMRAAFTVRSAFSIGDGGKASLVKGFFTSFLNPKGLLLFLSILPQFIDPAGAVAAQALALSGVFILLCALVYGAVGWLAGLAGRRAAVTAGGQRWLNGIAGCLLGLAAGQLALTQR